MGDLFDPTGFGLGFIALANPCSFALLPSYLGLFLNLKEKEEQQRSTIFSLNRAQVVSLFMTLGIITVFAPVGLIFTGLITAIGPLLPWINIGMGVGLLLLGIAMLRGYELVLKIPKLNKGGDSSTFGGIYLYGVSYAIAALGCSSPLVLLAFGSSTTRTSQFGTLLSFSLGMGAALSIVTLAVAFGKKRIVNSFRSIMPRVNMFSAVVLVIAGLYLAYYGWWTQDVLGRPKGPVRYVESMQASLEGWLRDLVNPLGLLPEAIQRANLLGLIFLTLNLVLIILGVLSRRKKRRTT